LQNKSVFWLLIAGLLIIVTILAACVAEPEVELIDGKPVMKHDLGIGFENCFVCHAGGLYPVPKEYAEMPLELCSSPACHILIGTTPTPPTTTPPTTTPPTTGPAEPPPLMSPGHDIYAARGGMCLICHSPGMGKQEFPIGGPNDHTGRTNEECLTCHEVPK